MTARIEKPADEPAEAWLCISQLKSANGLGLPSAAFVELRALQEVGSRKGAHRSMSPDLIVGTERPFSQRKSSRSARPAQPI